MRGIRKRFPGVVANDRVDPDLGEFRLQVAGTHIAAALLNMLPYLATILVLVVITCWEALSKRVGAPAALARAYVREEK